MAAERRERGVLVARDVVGKIQRVQSVDADQEHVAHVLLMMSIRIIVGMSDATPATQGKGHSYGFCTLHHHTFLRRSIVRVRTVKVRR